MAPPRSVIVVLNAAAGTANAKSDVQGEIEDLFRKAGCDAEILTVRAGQNPTDVARAARARSCVVVAAGGDGTVSSVAAAMVDSEAALGVLPLGTLNHFAKDLGIPLDLGEAVRVLVAGHAARVDVGTVNDRVFINNSSIGIYPDIVEARDTLQRRGHRKWAAFAIATGRVLRQHDGVTVTIDMDGRVRRWRTPFVFVGNNEYAIEGSQVGARASLQNGKLFVYLAPRARMRDLPVLLAKALLGRASQSGAVEIADASEVTLRTARPERMKVAMDGEVATMSTPLRYCIRPRALRVLVPPT